MGLQFLREKHTTGFTLAEVLIALALLGVVAAFAIPKILQSQQEQKRNALAKETIASIASAYMAMKAEGKLSDNQTKMSDILEQKLNVTRDTTSLTDYALAVVTPSATIGDCAAAPRICYRLPNGVMLTSASDYRYRSSGTTSALWIAADIDGKSSGATTRPGEAVGIYIYENGRVITAGKDTQSPTLTQINGGNPATDSLVSYPAGTYTDPTWLKW